MAVAAPWERAEGKIQREHRDRLAVVYVRQSTPQQVINHMESTRLQYGLVQRALDLGWPADRVQVIDDDLGHSASGVQIRAGFQRLVSEVGQPAAGGLGGLPAAGARRSLRPLRCAWRLENTGRSPRKKCASSTFADREACPTWRDAA